MLAIRKGRLKDQNVKNVIPNTLASLEFYKQKMKFTTHKCLFRQIADSFLYNGSIHDYKGNKYLLHWEIPVNK